MGLTPEEINTRLNNLRRYPNPSGELKVIERSLYPKKNQSKKLTEKVQLLQNNINRVENRRNKNRKELDVTLQLLKSLKDYTNKLETLCQISEGEKNSMISSKEYTQLMRYTKAVEKELDSYKDYPEISDKVSEIRDKINNSENLDSAKFIFEHIGMEMVDSEVLEYYQDLRKIHPGVERIKNQILECRTLREAQNTYLRLKHLIKEKSNNLVEMKTNSPVIQETKQLRRFDLNRVKREGWL